MNRRLSLTAVCLSLAPLAAWPAPAVAQFRHNTKLAAPTCEAVPQPSCEMQPQPNCAAPPPCKPPCNQPPPQQMPVMVQQPGVFMQPPANGTVQGPVEQRALEGAGITFPELNLRFPSIRFPNMTRSRQNARMILDSQAAPYVEGPTVPMMPAQPAAAPVAAAPVEAAPVAAAPQMMMAAPQMAAAPQMMMMAAPQMMTAPQMMMAPVQMAPQYVPQQYYQQPPAAPQPMQQPQPPPDNSPPPRAPSPSCDARGVSMTMLPAEEKIRQLEIAEQQLQQRIDQLRKQLEQIEMTHRPPVPSPDLGARAIQAPGTQQLRPVGIHPISQPIPQQPVVQPVQPATRVYNERPAGFISEPQMQAQYSQPQSQVIREPQAPTAAITGFRSR